MKRGFVASMAVGLALITAAPAVAQAADPFTGVWLIDYAATGGGAADQRLTIEVRGDEETYQSALTQPDGTRQVTNYVARYDGKEYPSRTELTGGPNPPAVRQDTVVLRKISDRQRNRYWSRDGKLSRVLERIVSADGRTLSSQITDYDASGAEKRGLKLIFRKQ